MQHGSNVKLGDERKKGVEAVWRTEYGARFRAGCKNMAYPVGSGPLQVTLETVLAEKIVQRSIHGPHMARASLRQLDKADTGYIEYKHFCKFLHEFNVTLMEEEIQKALKKYQCEGDGRIAYKQLLYQILPEEFNAYNTPPALPSLDCKRDWCRWNAYRLAERKSAAQ